MTPHLLVERFTGGYQSKPDPTNIDPATLVSPSQNVLVNDAEKVSVRGGYSLYGAAATALTPILSAFDWSTSRATEKNLRFYNGNLEWYSGAWETLLTGLSTTKPIRWTTWWSTTEKIDLLLFVNNSSTLYEWSGAETTYASSTATTITKQGSSSWASLGFLTAGTRKIRVKDSSGTWQEFTYTGGETTTALTGVTPDPTAFTFTAGAIAVQSVRSNANTPASGYTNDLISVLNNQVYVGSETSRLVYVSKNTDFTSYTFSSPRVSGEGANLILDNATVALVPIEQQMYISAGKSDWYRTAFETITLSAGSVVETLQVKKLKTGALQGARSQEFTEVIGNAVAFLSNEPVLRLLGRVEQLEDIQFRAVSDPVKTDFDAENWTNGSAKWYRNRLYLSAPANDRVWIWQVIESADGARRTFWQAPQTLPIRIFAIIAGTLYGHSSRVPETYQLFNGTNDNANSFTAIAALAYRSYRKRDALKTLDEWLTEGYISANTVLKLTLNYDYMGFTQTLEKSISGSDDAILYETITPTSLGDQPFGEESLGGPAAASAATLPKFRHIFPMAPADFFEIQAVYSTDAVDSQWELLALGGNVRVAGTRPALITK